MKTENLTKLVKGLDGDSILLLGNGINNYAQIGCSWKELLKQLHKSFLPTIPYKEFPKGISNTEYFDAMEIAVLEHTRCFDDSSFKPMDFLFDISKTEEIFKKVQAFAQNPTTKLNFPNLKSEITSFRQELERFKTSGYDKHISIMATLGDKFRTTIHSKLIDFICTSMESWNYSEKHRKVIEFAMANNIPVLTTNYDNLLAKTVNARFYDFSNGHIDVSSPISCCYTTQSTPNINDFAIWHPNGMIRYRQSILIGLTHYMRNLGKIRSKIFCSNNFNAELFENIYNETESIGNTWIKLIFTKNMFIFGLTLDQDEVVLRWLLLERAKFYSLYPYMRKEGWFVLPKKEYRRLTSGKRCFLKSIGFKVVCMEDYESMYNAISV